MTNKFMEVATVGQNVLAEVERAVVGKRSSLEMIMAATLAGGHVLLEDFPGLGKTLIARSFSTALGLDFKRIQFTPDLLPGDITGGYVLDRSTNHFELRQGPIFTNVALADEINRASPKTQSALLEAMQEGQVTLEGKTMDLPKPFLVLATQNLVEEKHQLEKKLEGMYQQQANMVKEALAQKSKQLNGRTIIVEKVELPHGDALKNIAYALRNQFEDLFMVLAANVNGKPQVAVMLGPKTEAEKKFHAGEMVKTLAKEIGGGGGGQPFYATAGGKNLSGLDAVVKKGREMAGHG